MILRNLRRAAMCLLLAGMGATMHAQDLIARQAPVDRRLRAVDSVSIQRAVERDMQADYADLLYSSWVTNRAHPYAASEVPDSFTINADGMRIKQVLINLLTNAEKFTSKGEINLHVSLTEVPNHITFAVSDTGRGIPADKAEAIFERFNKLDSFVQGTGLGLNICRIIADQMHGTVKVDTTYTAGARLVFSIPL